MAGGRVCTGGRGKASNSNVFLHNLTGTRTSEPRDAFFLSESSSSFLGSRSMVSFEDVQVKKGCTDSFLHPFDRDDNRDEDFDDFLHQPEKKRRLTVDQVQFLEKSFEFENKLEPERKVQLAKDLSLQPRQVAIWFQNRRARWKTKQLEKDYDTLQGSYNSLKADYESLLKEKDALNAQVVELKEKLLKEEKQPNSLEQIDDKKLQEPTPSNLFDTASEGEGSKVTVLAYKQEDISSAKSDIVDSYSPHNTDGVHSSFTETSYVFEPDQSDLSQGEEDSFSKDLFPVPPNFFPKLADAHFSDLSASSCNLGFQVQEHGIWSWSY